MSDMPDLIPSEIPVQPATDIALRQLRAENDALTLAVANLRDTLKSIEQVAFDTRTPEVYRLNRILFLSREGLAVGRGVQKRTVTDRIRAWWQTHRAR